MIVCCLENDTEGFLVFNEELGWTLFKEEMSTKKIVFCKAGHMATLPSDTSRN